MAAVFVCFFFWLGAVVLETTIFASVSWFHPNLLLLISILFSFRWRGSETYFIALLYGLSADCFSTLPFGIFGIIFFTISFITRWYGVKVFQGSNVVFLIYVGIASFLNGFFVLIILYMVFSRGLFSFSWLRDLVFTEVIPSIVVAIPLYHVLIAVEEKYKIRLSERKF